MCKLPVDIDYLTDDEGEDEEKEWEDEQEIGALESALGEENDDSEIEQ